MTTQCPSYRSEIRCQAAAVPPTLTTILALEVGCSRDEVKCNIKRAASAQRSTSAFASHDFEISSRSTPQIRQRTFCNRRHRVYIG
jgi:hypothetical protein